MNSFSIKGNIVDIFNKEIYFGEINVANKKISTIIKLGEAQQTHFIIPGFVDSHVHIESSMLVPAEFAKLAVVHGTVATISDPHEIANVCGLQGVNFMIKNGKTVPFKFHFGAPSCVPATIFETAGDELNVNDVETLLQSNDIFYLSEMMNFPGVLNDDEIVLQKIAAAKKYNKPIDGHAPGLIGNNAKKYINAGISTDHECFTESEALCKLKLGMKILIREGSAAKNFDALINLLNEYWQMIMFCSDDKHPDSLALGHINQLCARAVAKGIDLFKILQAACINPVLHYKMNCGLLREGDAADFVLLNDIINFKVIKTFIDGELVAENGISYINSSSNSILNNFKCDTIELDVLKIIYNNENTIPVIEALDGQLITNKIFVTPKIINQQMVSDVANDILKIVVVNRYQNAPVAKGFIKNFGLTEGAIASSVAHDSHNIVAVGVDDESLLKAINLIINSKGGVSACTSLKNKQCKEMILSLPVAGLMSTDDGYTVAKKYTAIDNMVKTQLGSKLSAPFMTLSFMALLVIPHLKLSDKGLFDGDTFSFIN